MSISNLSSMFDTIPDHPTSPPSVVDSLQGEVDVDAAHQAVETHAGEVKDSDTRASQPSWASVATIASVENSGTPKDGSLKVSDEERGATNPHHLSPVAVDAIWTPPDTLNDPPGRAAIEVPQGGREMKTDRGPEANVPDRFELFLLGEGEKRTVEQPDTRTPNTSIFTISKEDHTLANMVRVALLKDKHVNFCGYRVPHPLFATFELRIQTDGEITPKDALKNACQGLVADLGHLSRDFTKEWELRKMVAGDGANNA